MNRNTIRAVLAAIMAISVGIVALSIAVVVAFTQIHRQLVAINAERTHNVIVNCEDVNRRHEATIRRLRQLVADLPPGPRRVKAVQGMAGSIALIDALAPNRDCRALARQQIATNP